jgi:L-fuconolactonase
VKVDAHVHVWPPGVAVDATVAAAGSVDVAAETLVRAGVEAAVLVQPAACGLDHSYLLAAARSGRLLAAAVAQADPGDERSLEVVTGLVREAGVAGFRLPLVRAGAGWLDRHAEDYWSLAAGAGAVVSLLLAPWHLDAVEELAGAHRRVPVVIDHLARFDLADHPDGAIARLCALSSVGNVHVKASALGALGGEACRQARRVVAAFGPERVLWGSDYPFVLEHEPYEDALRAAGRAFRDAGTAGAAAILGGNALRLFFGGPGAGR